MVAALAPWGIIPSGALAVLALGAVPGTHGSATFCKAEGVETTANLLGTLVPVRNLSVLALDMFAVSVLSKTMCMYTVA